MVYIPDEIFRRILAAGWFQVEVSQSGLCFAVAWGFALAPPSAIRHPRSAIRPAPINAKTAPKRSGAVMYVSKTLRRREGNAAAGRSVTATTGRHQAAEAEESGRARGGDGE